MRLDRVRELEVFVACVAAGGISAGARRLGTLPSSVSRTVKGLEARLGITLLARGPRLFRLTAEGEALYERGRRLLSEFDALEQDVSDRGQPKGTLRISMSVAFGRIVILPLLARFREQYPGIVLHLSFSDRHADLEGGEADVALRVGPLKDSDLTARKLGRSPRVFVASPTYLAAKTRPLSPSDLASHDCLRLVTNRSEPWRFVVNGVVVTVEPQGPIEVDEGESLAQLALAGHGIARVGKFHVKEALGHGHLVELLDEFEAEDADEIYAVFLGGRSTPERVRVFIEFLTRTIPPDSM